MHRLASVFILEAIVTRYFNRVFSEPSLSQIGPLNYAPIAYRVSKQFLVRSNLRKTERIQEISFSADCWNRVRKGTIQKFPQTFYGPNNRQVSIICGENSPFWVKSLGRRVEENRCFSQKTKRSLTKCYLVVV